MKNTSFIEIYIVNDDPLFIKDFNANFTFQHAHKLNPALSVEDFLSQLHNQNNNYFTIVIINDMIVSHGLNTKSVVDILPMIKNIDKENSVIVLTDNDNLELKLSSSELRPDAFIKNDKMLYFKLIPTINRIICKYDLKKSKRNLHFAIIIAAIVIILTIIQIVVASIIS